MNPNGRHGPKRKYTAEQQATGVQLVGEVGLAEAHRRLGIPKATLNTWCRVAGVPVNQMQRTINATQASAVRRAELREQLRTMLLEKAVDVLERMDRKHTDFKGQGAAEVTYPIAPAGAVKDYAISVGILIDKYRLEVGEPTDRSEHTNLTSGYSDHERRRLRDFIDSLEPAADPARSGGETGDPG